MHLMATSLGVGAYWSSWHDLARDSNEMLEFLGMDHTKGDRCDQRVLLLLLLLVLLLCCCCCCCCPIIPVFGSPCKNPRELCGFNDGNHCSAILGVPNRMWKGSRLAAQAPGRLVCLRPVPA
jgi:hypothetical protein